MPEDRRTMADLAELLGVKTATIRHYRAVSAPGGRYADHPFPKPSGHLGQTPYWLAERDDEIRAWAATRPGKGVGGGRPAHRPATAGLIAGAQKGNEAAVSELIHRARNNNRAALDRMED